MLKRLYAKLVFVLVLLILSLMSVISILLTGSIAGFFMSEFNSQMHGAFSENVDFVTSLREAAEAENAPEQLQQRLVAYSGLLGINYHSRFAYVLDGRSAEVLRSAEGAPRVDLTANVLSALQGEVGDEQRMNRSFFDCAVPLSSESGEVLYIIYIHDNKSSVNLLNAELFGIIIRSVLLALGVSIILALVLSKTLTRPIENLSQSTTLVARGDFSRKLDVHSQDEIGVLTENFNDMAVILQHTMETVADERDKLSTLFLYLTDGVAAFGRDGTPQHVNPAALRLLGLWKTEELRYELFEPLMPLAEVLRLPPEQSLECDMRVGVTNLHVYAAPYGSSEAESGLMVVIHDTTEQTRLDDLRKEFVSNVSHELRTPLTGIKSYAEALTEPEGMELDTIRSFSEVIVGETDRMTRLVRDLLALSRFDYGNVQMAHSPYDMTLLLQRVYDLLDVQAREHGHTLVLNLLTELPPMRGDYDRVEQVMINIISNAITYTPDRGRIEIEAGANEFEVEIWVKDNGIGIPAEDLPNLFERFYRVDKARSRSMGGTGLGLAIAREITIKQGGEIHIYSELDKGTAVQLRLPLIAPTESRP